MKKIIAIALMLILCLSIVSMAAFAANDKMTVKVTAPADWAECYVYSWEPEAFGSWPGTKIEGGSFELTSAVAGMVISAGNNMPQTVDITDLVYTAGGEATITVGDAVDGKHTYSITTGTPNPTDPTTEPTTQPTTQPTTAPTGNRTLTIEAPASWTKVYVYTWNPEEFSTYPGAEVQKSGNVYKASIKKSLVNLIVTGEKADSTQQKTDDLVLETNGKDVTIKIADDGKATITYAGASGNNGGNRKPAAEAPQGNLSNYRVVGNAVWMGSWDAASNLGQMIDMGNGIYRKNFDNVEPGSYELKITKDGKWDNAIGVNGNNFTFTVDQKCTITVDFNANTGVIEVYGIGVPGTSDITMLSVVVLLALASVTAVVLIVNKKKFI